MIVTEDDLVVHFRTGAPSVRLCGRRARSFSTTSMAGGCGRTWRSTAANTSGGDALVQAAVRASLRRLYSLKDVMDCLAGELDEPKNSGRRVAVALEVEIALKQSSAQDGARVDLPLEDRSLGLNYDWFR